MQVQKLSDTAFAAGLRAGFSPQPFMVFIAMMGFGSLAKSQDLGIGLTLLSAIGTYGIPGQVAMLELYATGAGLLAILTAVSMANMRFLPMTIVLMPIFRPAGKLFRWRYLIVQMVSVNSWSHMQHVYPDMPQSERLSYFTAFALVCFCSGAAGSALGWYMAASMPFAISVTLIFLNPAYFIFLFCSNRRRNILFALAAGAVLGPFSYLLSADWGLPLCGLVAGTLAWYLGRIGSGARA